MLLHFGTDTIQPEWDQSVVSIGTFDGVHLGHQDLLRRTVLSAREREWPSIVVTFDRNPTAIVNPEKTPFSIASLNDNCRMIGSLGISLAVILEFNATISRMSAQEFFDKIVIGKLRAAKIVVGHDFAFGNARVGTPEWLSQRIETEIVEPFLVDGERVSSSVIRSKVQAGDVEGVAVLRGAPFEIPGVVVKGQQLGRTIGFPTVNIARSTNQITPKDGIYAGWAKCAGGEFKAAISIGMRPTVAGQNRTIEAFLLDYPGDNLYGQAMTLGLVKRLRDEQKFDSLDALVEQMQHDVALVREPV